MDIVVGENTQPRAVSRNQSLNHPNSYRGSLNINYERSIIYIWNPCGN